MNLLLVLPLLIPLMSAAVSLLLWKRPRAQRWLGVVGSLALLAAGLTLLTVLLLARFPSGLTTPETTQAETWKKDSHPTDAFQPTILVSRIGDWPAPYGITLVADLFSAVMVVLAGVVGLASAVYSLASIDEKRTALGYYALVQVLLLGVCGAFLTGDLFNLYVWFEVMLVASFVLMALGGELSQLRGAIKYVTLNLLSSAFFLSAVGILYGVVGTLNLADLSRKLMETAQPELVTVLGMMFLVAFGIKSAMFPLFFWLPASYHKPPVAVSALFAGLLTKVGVYALIRVFLLLFVEGADLLYGFIVLLSGLTMVTGVLGAAAQSEFRRILSFHIISQIGYMTLGLGLAGLTRSTIPAILALAGSIFYIAHHIIVKTNLFLVSGIVRRLGGSFELKDLGGLYQSRPGVAILFLIPALSLAGMPPLSGFFAKFALVRVSLETGHFTIAATALVVGLLTLYSMSKIWVEAFWKPLPSQTPQTALPVLESARLQNSQLGSTNDAFASQPVSGEHPYLPVTQWWPSVGLASLTVAMGLLAELMFILAVWAAEQLLDPHSYAQIVLENLR